MRDFIEEVGVPFAVIVGFIALFMIAMFVLFAALNRVECENLTEVTKRKTDFRWIGGCYVEHEGEMLPYERWKLLDVRVTTRK